MDSPDPAASSEHLVDETQSLRDEIARLRGLVGPSEKSYEDLTIDARNARDSARRAEQETGRLRARIVELENEVRRWQRDFVWFRDRVVRRVPLIGRIIGRLQRR